MIDQKVWLAARATSYTVVCEECAAEHGYFAARVEGRPRARARARRHLLHARASDQRRGARPTSLSACEFQLNRA